MDKLEKVMMGLECCSIGLYCPDEECLYEQDKEEKQDNCIAALARDALELLKAQEPKPPRFTVAYDKIFYGCDNCGKSLVVMANSEGLVLQQYLPKYCPECGQAVKWPEPPKEVSQT